MHLNTEFASRNDRENYHISAHLCKCRLQGARSQCWGRAAVTLQYAWGLSAAKNVKLLWLLGKRMWQKRVESVWNPAVHTPAAAYYSWPLPRSNRFCLRPSPRLREGAALGPSVAHWHSSRDVAAGRPSLLCPLHLPGPTHFHFSFRGWGPWW